MHQPQIIPISQLVEPWENPIRNPAGGNEKAVGVPVAVLPPGHTVESLKPILDAYRTRPEHREGIYRLQPRSFVDFVQRFRNNDTMSIFISRSLLWYNITAVFDWHPSGGNMRDTGRAVFRAVTRTRNPDSLIRPLGLPTTSIFYGSSPK